MLKWMLHHLHANEKNVEYNALKHCNLPLSDLGNYYIYTIEILRISSVYPKIYNSCIILYDIY